MQAELHNFRIGRTGMDWQDYLFQAKHYSATAIA
jgi:hypothetical protein